MGNSRQVVSQVQECIEDAGRWLLGNKACEVTIRRNGDVLSIVKVKKRDSKKQRPKKSSS